MGSPHQSGLEFGRGCFSHTWLSAWGITSDNHLLHFHRGVQPCFRSARASQVALLIKNPPASAGDKRDTGSVLRRKHPLEEGVAIHCSILAWEIPRTEEPGGPQSIGLHRVRHNGKCSSKINLKSSCIESPGSLLEIHRLRSHLDQLG